MAAHGMTFGRRKAVRDGCLLVIGYGLLAKTKNQKPITNNQVQPKAERP
jgi:hypothetical protein